MSIELAVAWAASLFGCVGWVLWWSEAGRRALEVLEGQLAGPGAWLAFGRAPLADIACYPYVKRAPEGGLALDPYPQVQAWLERCEALPGWIEMDP